MQGSALADQYPCPSGEGFAAARGFKELGGLEPVAPNLTMQNPMENVTSHLFRVDAFI